MIVLRGASRERLRRDVTYKDIANTPEDDRIDTIGRTVMEQKLSVAFIVDSELGKADRYIEKLRKRFPGIVVIGRGDGPVTGTVYVKVGPPVN